MHTRPSRLRAIHLRGLLPLLLGAIAGATGCTDASTTGIDDPALRGATVGEIEALIADMPDGTSERQYFLNLAGPDAARLRLRFVSDAAPMLTTGDRVGVWGDRL